MFAIVVVLQLAASVPVSSARICEDLSFDLDGDGVLDRFATVSDSCGHGGCFFDVYLSKRPKRRAGRVSGCFFRVGKRHAFGVHELLAWWRLGKDRSFSRFRFDGRRFVQSSR